MSISAAQASRFDREIILHQQVWGIRDSGGFPAPFEVEAIPVAVWLTRGIAGPGRDGILVGPNWSGVRATGYDVQPLKVRAGLEASE